MGNNCCYNSNTVPDPIPDVELTTRPSPTPYSPSPTRYKPFQLQSSFMPAYWPKISDLYQLTAKLGAGTFGWVHRATNKITGLEYAIKTISKITNNSEQQKRIILEIDALRKLKHPNILKLYEMYEDDRSYHLVTQLCTGGMLIDRKVGSQHIAESKKAEYMCQILSAVYFCHENGIAHRDLKPDNILLLSREENSPIQIIDFGCSMNFNDYKPGNRMTLTGSPKFIAPEVMSGTYDAYCDVWSWGIILYQLLSDEVPFNGETDIDVLQSTLWEQLTFQADIWETVSDPAKDLVTRMLEKDPRKRISILECLTHAWISSNTRTSTPYCKYKSLPNLQTIKSSVHFQRTVLEWIKKSLMTQEEVDEVIADFTQMQGDGRDLAGSMHGRFSSSTISEKSLASQCTRESVDSPQIDYSKFLKSILSKYDILNDQNLRRAFTVQEKSISGLIDRQYLIEELGLAGQEVNISKQIAYPEFADIIRDIVNI